MANKARILQFLGTDTSGHSRVFCEICGENITDKNYDAYVHSKCLRTLEGSKMFDAIYHRGTQEPE
jgi:hypothetical protein